MSAKGLMHRKKHAQSEPLQWSGEPVLECQRESREKASGKDSKRQKRRGVKTQKHLFEKKRQKETYTHTHRVEGGKERRRE